MIDETSRLAILIEYQRCLHQMRHIAYELQEGALLESTIHKFMELLEQRPSTSYLSDCLESLFHIYFNRDNIALAEQTLEKQKKLLESHQQTNSAHAMHLTKLMLYKLVKDNHCTKENIINHVLKHFWQGYDQHKQAYHHDRSYRNKLRLLKDYILLFFIRCALTGTDPTVKTPVKYILNEANKIFASNTNFHNKLTGLINNCISQIASDGYIYLNHDYKMNCHRIRIPVSKAIIDALKDELNLLTISHPLDSQGFFIKNNPRINTESIQAGEGIDSRHPDRSP